MTPLFTRLLLLSVILILNGWGFFIFARGFFPKKLLLPGYGVDLGLSNAPKPLYNKLVFMIVDAMRADFMFGPNSNMPNVHQLIRQGYGVPFTAFSTPPTVTLPRIKGLTTGSTPNFLDAILNIAESDTSSTLAGQDSWLYQLKNQNKTIHMFGDDTWIKLFPGMFDKTDGTASFFVSDFTEVDNNVTRHLPEELAPDAPWDLLILHYLGLDHIGHKGGPESPFMPAKQQEMDNIIYEVFNSIDENTLMVVAGDHGMNEAGNHGGSSSGETSAAMVMLGRKFQDIPHADVLMPYTSTSPDYQYCSRIQQADLIPSLSSMLGFPIPKNSLGVIPQLLLPLWEDGELSAILEANARQMAEILQASYKLPDIDVMTDIESLNQLEKISFLWKKSQMSFEDHETVYEFLQECQKLLSRASSTYNVTDMVVGCLLEALAAVISIGVVVHTNFSKKLKFVTLLLSAIYLSTMYASSLVEEEQQFWYWSLTGCLAWIYTLSVRKGFKNSSYWIMCLALVRIIRSWNQTGQKYAGSPDIVKILIKPENSIYLWLLNIAYYTYLFVNTWHGSGVGMKFLASGVTITSSFVFKVSMAMANGEHVPGFLRMAVASETNDANHLIQLARLSFVTLGGFLFYEVTEALLADERNKSITKISYLVEVFLVTQTRSYNIPLFIFFNFLRNHLQRALAINKVDSRDAAALLVVLVLILQHVTFFAFGGSNSLASIDLANAYNGISSYNIGLVGILTFVSNWIGPLYWSMAGLSILFESKVEGLRMVRRIDIMSIRIFLTQVFFSMAATGIMTACIILKDHLFIWTVFSPKLLYAAAWLMIQNGLVDTVMTLILVLLIG